MSRRPTPTAPTAWPFSTVDEMIAKAERELDRLRHAEKDHNRLDAIDHAINACVAACHVADWAHDRGLSVNHPEWEPFCVHLVARSRALRACRDIADFYKHSRIKRPRVIEGDGVSVGYALAATPGALGVRAKVS